MKLEFYPSEELEQAIRREARETGMTVSSIITEKLELAFGIKSENDDVIFSDALAKIIQETDEYVKTCKEDSETEIKDFTLYESSETFRKISMSENGKISSIRARIGKSFRKAYEDGKIEGIEPAQVNGNQKRRHNAAVYNIL